MRMIELTSFFLMTLICGLTAHAVDQDYREPFTIRLKIDKDRVYESQVTNQTLFVSNNVVQVFPNESFGVSLSVDKEKGVILKYEKEPSKRDITFSLRQHAETGEDPMMMLITRSRLEQAIRFQVMKTRPDRVGLFYSGEVNARQNIPDYCGLGNIVTELRLFNFEVLESRHAKGKQ